ncbi:hypothetical protein BG53_13870 [Paenibacillus darwinianus]|uniref:Uncharacterized protein n=1 Tax=Paenibacillus darwinianus TaxID=1380763 RepID=A0A9W5S245_9BACL|nr:hypothetical protein [Paenibacillus darwinianus]EXX89818.1 hypothetical protein BG52_14660 [Paenibacillus darwinianus]EXX90202.1 hypothetical protein BG53_13870 [Paenibacillus darwinianus]EXX90624.1 hypothetical protein CH50_15000 [Paenibacillus darwinianus]
MSRSWERKVRRNTDVINKQRKKEGKPSLSATAARTDRYVGRNYLLPALLVLFTVFYIYMVTIPTGDPNAPRAADSAMFWVTIAAYLLLAVLFFFRRPYLSVSKDCLGTRRMTGDKLMLAPNIKSISVRPGYVVVEQAKGANWVFSRMMNRYPTDQMAERLRIFAKDNGIPFQEETT